MSGLFSAVGRGLSAAGYAAGDLYAKQALQEQGSDLELTRQQRLLEFKEALETSSREKQAARIQGKTAQLADEALAKKRGLVSANIADPGSWTSEQQAAVDASLGAERADMERDPDLVLQAAAATGDLAQKDLALIARDDKRLAASERAAARKEAFDREREDRRDVREIEREDRRDARAAAAEAARDIRQARALEAAEERWRRSSDNRVPSGYRVAADGKSLEFIPGGPADPNTKPAGGKPLNEGQSKALLFGARMQAANEVLDELEGKGKKFSTPGANTPIVGAAVNLVNSKQGQMLDQAKRDFLNAVLRRESGAVISDAEFDNGAKQYFPAPGDDSEVIAQKRNNRVLATRAILAEVPDGESRVRQVRDSDAAPAGKGGPKTGAEGSWGAPAAPKGWGIREIKPK